MVWAAVCAACVVGKDRQVETCASMATAAPKVYRELGTPLDIPDDKMGAAAIAAYYACEGSWDPRLCRALRV